jgi:hypothetical protein
MKRMGRSSLSLLLTILLPGCLAMPGAFSPRPGVKGHISGIVVNAKGRPVAAAIVEGVWIQRWTIIFPPPGFAMVDCSAKSDANGRFAFAASRKLDELDAYTPDFGLTSRLEPVVHHGNIVRLIPDPQLSGPSQAASHRTRDRQSPHWHHQTDSASSGVHPSR